MLKKFLNHVLIHLMLICGIFAITFNTVQAEDSQEKLMLDVINMANEELKRNPNNADAYIARGAGYIYFAESKGDTKYFDYAISDLTKAIQINPKYANAYKARGIAYASMADSIIEIFDNSKKVKKAFYSKQSIDDLTKAIQLDPNDAQPYGMRGYVYWKIALGDYSDEGSQNFKNALSDLNKAIKISPKEADNYYYRGMTHYYLENYRSAINDFTE